MKGLKGFAVIPAMLGMAVALTFHPNLTVASIGTCWIGGTVPFAFMMAGLIAKNWLDDEHVHRVGVVVPRRVVTVEPDVLCKRCGVHEATTTDGYCMSCHQITMEVTEL